MARKIVFTSGKGGVGKTTLATRLGVYLAEKGERVIVCDCDFGLNNADIATGVENLIIYDLVDVLEGKCRAKQALVRHPELPNLHILSSAKFSPERYVSPQALKVVLDSLSPQFDYILLDCPAGVEEGFHRAVACADEGIVVLTPSVSSLRDASKVLALLKSYSLSSLSLVINKVRGDLLYTGECLSPQEISNLLKTPILGVLPEEYALFHGSILKTHGAIKILGNNLRTGKNKLYDTTKKYAGLLGAIRRALKRNLL